MADEGGIKRELEEDGFDHSPAAKRVKRSDSAEIEAAQHAVEAAHVTVKDEPAWRGESSYSADHRLKTRLQTG
jgi:hypothetical protein